jgi:23S rRNA (adenine2030-N6)-methyltransferase
LNYRHAYHAGNFADVVKHAALALVLEHLAAKDKPFAVLDTHAGIGRYDLAAIEAEKTGEYRDGILKVLDRPHPALAPYLRVVAALNPPDPRSAGNAVPRIYPGSPELIARLTRPQDRIQLVELHPEDAAALAAAYAGDPRIAVYGEDGYAALKALLPPQPRRGLVLIDAPFEVTDEFARLARGLRHAHRRFATGIYLLWYPIKARAPVAAFHGELAQGDIRRIAVGELLLRPDDDPERLNGCGLVIVNPPWRLVETLGEMLEWLRGRLAPHGGRARVATLVPE